MKIVVDKPTTPAGRSRCQHDLLDGECFWCKGAPAELDLFGPYGWNDQ